MSWMLFVPRLLRPIVSPCGVVWLFLILVGVYFLWKKQHRRIGILCLLCALFFSLMGGRPFPAYLLGSLEKPYQSVRLENLPTCDVIVLLGGGQSYSDQNFFGMELSDAGDRIIGAFEALRQKKADTLAVSGGSYWSNGKELNPSVQLANWAKGWDLFDVNKMVFLEPCQNTRHEAQSFKKLAQEKGWKKVMLVTSAFHMRRSVATFEEVGFEVVPFPVDFYVVGIPQRKPLISLVPGSRELKLSELWFKETLGYWIYRMTN